MSITEELERLGNLHASGVLTESEFAKAKAQLLGGAVESADHVASSDVEAVPKPVRLLDAKVRLGPIVRVSLLVLVGIGAIAWFSLRHVAGERAANRVAASVINVPIELVNEVENVPASSWHGSPLQLPYAGEVHINVKVLSGNKMKIHLLAASELPKYKAEKEFQHVPAFHAKSTKTYERSGRLGAGTYYLVLRDDTLGILSASASDVRVRARLVP